jgi:hypothetical protein
MKKTIFFTVLIVAFGTLVFSQRKPNEKPEKNFEAPLALPNSVIPELMGAARTKKGTNLSTAELAGLEENKRFRTYLENSYIQLPLIENIRMTKDGNFHHVPTEVIGSSEIFGEIADRIKANPALTREALRFYSACAVNEQLITSVRAVCTRNLKDWAKIAKIDVSKVEIPDDIIRIADVLPHRN